MSDLRLDQQHADPIVLDSNEEDARPLRELNDVRRRRDNDELRAFDLRFSYLRDLGPQRNLPPPILHRVEAPPPYQARVLQALRAAALQAAALRARTHAAGVAQAAAASPAAPPTVSAPRAAATPAPPVENAEEFHSYVHVTINRATAGVRRTTYVQTLRSIMPSLPSSPTKPRFKRAALNKLRYVIFCAGRIDPTGLARLHESSNVVGLILEARRIATDNIDRGKKKTLSFRADQQDWLLRGSRQKESSLIAAKDICRTVIRDLERLAGDV
ncbi:hypothetical protein TI39_contig47g00018 [Zymoseptoria brevis]|uniref:Uncharacterized protein n=1 Tax=Zymoseptoria brevis TaxID=1047168 RepID=A0A0F4GYL3_9PEZI|nr:hypothetical protein TI39_contig47g00018 [Zymoseptoria brevis]